MGLNDLLSINKAPDKDKRQFFQKNWPKKILNTPGSDISEIIGTRRELGIEKIKKEYYREVITENQEYHRVDETEHRETRTQNYKENLTEERRYRQQKGENKRGFDIEFGDDFGDQKRKQGVPKWSPDFQQNKLVINKKTRPKMGSASSKKKRQKTPENEKFRHRPPANAKNDIFTAKIPLKEKTVAKIIKKNKKRREKEIEGRMKKIENQKDKKAFNAAEDLTEKLSEMNHKLDEYLKEKLNPLKRKKKVKEKKEQTGQLADEFAKNEEAGFVLEDQNVANNGNYNVASGGDQNPEDGEFVFGRRRRVPDEEESELEKEIRRMEERQLEEEAEMENGESGEVVQIMIESEELKNMNRIMQMEVHAQLVIVVDFGWF